MTIPVKCWWEGCSLVFACNSTLNRHIKFVHKKERPFICPEVDCGAAFSSAYGLKRHNRLAHLKERKFVCPVKECNAAFGCADNLKRHNKSIHLGERNYVCSKLKCNTVCNSAKDLRDHKRTVHCNGKETVYKCCKCEKTYNSSCGRSRHEMCIHGIRRLTNNTVEIEKPSFSCADCRFRTRWKTCLVRHISQKHSDDEHYKCHDCGRQFQGKYNLQRHIFGKHRTKYCETPIKDSQFRCLLCEQLFLLRSELCDHYVQGHGVDLNPKTLSFSSMQEFLNWKKEMEDSTITRFGLKWKNNQKLVYSCHRSGKYIEKSSDRKRAPLRRGSKKLNGVCPASITLLLNETDSSCVVTFVQTHIGHSTNDENELKYTFLRKEERQKLAGLLASGMSKRQILDEMKSCDVLPHDSMEANVTRNNLLSNKDLCNIQASYKVVQPHQENSKNVDNVKEKKRKSSVARKKIAKISPQLEALRKAHEEALNQPEISIELTEDGSGWLVPSFQTPKDGCVEIYVVRKIRDTCPNEDDQDIRACDLICTECQECAHKYSCSCIENGIYLHMCKHIHAVAMLLRENSEFFVQQSLSDCVVEPMPDEDVVYVESDTLLNENQKREVEEKFLSIARKISTSSEKNLAFHYLNLLEASL